MCSVVGCHSWRRSAQRFKLPADPERRLGWVQFLATVNKQRFKESSWTDITICSEHFENDCFENLTPRHSDTTGKLQLTLKPSAVPSQCLQFGELEPKLEKPACVEPVETTEVTCQRDELQTCDGPTSSSEESRVTSMAAQGGPVPRGVSTDTADAFISVYGQMHPKNVNFDLIKEKATLVQMKGKFVVNVKHLLQLFSCTCPLCGSKVKVEKVTKGVLVILNQQCVQCEYRNQWKNQVAASVPADGDQHLTGGTDVTAETQQAAPTDDTHSSITAAPESVAVNDDEGSDPKDETEESSDQDDEDSDEDWEPDDFLSVRMPQKKNVDETTNQEEKNDDPPPPAPKHGQLCTDCGKFLKRPRRHTCEHKIKPYSCNICGKRCVNELALNFHSRVHDEKYEHRCKYCNVTFKPKVDKINHEQIHATEEKPYKCPDCSQTFAKNKERWLHLEDHRGPRQLKCHICGIEFCLPAYLQRHLAVHTGVKEFKCSVCQRGFNQPGHLKSHMRLHTGERPYKCQHCDKCFTHNVSLKSHVQRYHTSNSGCEQEKEKINESDTGDAEGSGNKKSTVSEFDNIDGEQDTEKEVQRERADMTKSKKRSTGRPRGRPKRNESDSIGLDVEVEGQRSNKKTGKQKEQKLKRKQCNEEDSEESNKLLDSAEEEGSKNKVRTRGRPKNTDNDTDFDPEERKKKRCSSQNSAEGLGKRRGRPRKN